VGAPLFLNAHLVNEPLDFLPLSLLRLVAEVGLHVLAHLAQLVKPPLLLVFLDPLHLLPEVLLNAMLLSPFYLLL